MIAHLDQARKQKACTITTSLIALAVIDEQDLPADTRVQVGWLLRARRT